MNTEKRKLTGLNKFLIGFGVLVIIGGIMDLQSNMENGLGMFYTIAMVIIGAAMIYFGGGFFRRTVSDKKCLSAPAHPASRRPYGSCCPALRMQMSPS